MVLFYKSGCLRGRVKKEIIWITPSQKSNAVDKLKIFRLFSTYFADGLNWSRHLFSSHHLMKTSYFSKSYQNHK